MALGLPGAIVGTGVVGTLGTEALVVASKVGVEVVGLELGLPGVAVGTSVVVVGGSVGL